MSNARDLMAQFAAKKGLKLDSDTEAQKKAADSLNRYTRTRDTDTSKTESTSSRRTIDPSKAAEDERKRREEEREKERARRKAEREEEARRDEERRKQREEERQKERLARQQQRAQEKLEEERLQREREERRAKLKAEREAQQAADAEKEIERQKKYDLEREQRRKQREAERNKIDVLNAEEVTRQKADYLNQATLIEEKQKVSDKETPPENKTEELKTEKLEEKEPKDASKMSVEVIELKAMNKKLNDQVKSLEEFRAKAELASAKLSREYGTQIDGLNKTVTDLTTELELYRGKLSEKPLFNTKVPREQPWPEEIVQPELKVGVQAVGKCEDEYTIGTIQYDEGLKYDFGKTKFYKKDVFLPPPVSKELIENLVMLNNNLKARQQEVDKEHKKYVEGVEREMRELREKYEKMRDLYGADLSDMQSNFNNRVSKSFGLECKMAVEVAEGIKDVKKYARSNGVDRWYSSPSKHDDEMWAKLKNGNNGNVDYPVGRHDFKARVFQFYRSEDNELLCNELRVFKQEDLNRGCGYIIDTFNEVFVYYGTSAGCVERASIAKTALAYNKYSQDGRSKNTPVVLCEQGREPIRFQMQFSKWDQKRAGYQDTQDIFTDRDKHFDYGKLLKPDELPNWVDRSCLENYLNEEEFKAVFKMERSEFNMLPRWRKDAERRRRKLF
ncbi:trichoplein keratin filament-binding protein, putative [Entamoeba invadens IP1]|uniref:Trichoplein keratin filament-binding protein, putative n=1 Tax=Entamoeba invadens IP1 TaxID=370355 RepID=A0A0A1UBN9_ENTIV|nr:trichoplein keratin filament-binding protein, putative [Entamoeba invadens IP1]ELP92641.1 trichoplein keratin filament-binding protein, putative [Entamoeba invadens IP1]|eukprot:XP_004259412.1 trichoplein keratin filament-binding protein, putative [Entamoeba invadens IP1]